MSSTDEAKITEVLSKRFDTATISTQSKLTDGRTIVEIGPRLNFATAFSTNAVAIFNAIGLGQVTRVERSVRYRVPKDVSEDEFVSEHADKMTQMQYKEPLQSFAIEMKTEDVFDVLLQEEGKSALEVVNKEMGLGMDDWDIDFYYNLFINDIGRNPTNVECFQLGQANSEHSRHWFFKGKLVIDGEAIDKNLFEIVQLSYKANPNNSTIAFNDNSSAIRGAQAHTLIPKHSGKASPLRVESVVLGSTLTAETHNFPTGVAPRPGAETGTGGRIRDNQSTGRGAHVVAGTAGYCVGNLQIPGYDLPWESNTEQYPGNLASPLKIEIDASNGASDYGNKFGEPLIQGFTRSFGQRLPGGERREWLKPIMFTAGVGHIDERHLAKGAPKEGMLILQVGGPMYRIGVGGGAASSMIQGENAAQLDFNAVQRGDAEMEQKMNRVVRACIELGRSNPIVSIHDQGAGGPCNVVTEIVEPVGGAVDIRNVNVGDASLSVLEIWSAEAQERSALLIHPRSLELFKSMCAREQVPYEVLGRVTGSGKIVLTDSQDNTTPVDLELAKILGKMPQKTFTDNTETPKLEALKLPKGVTLADVVQRILRLLSVGSKRFLVTKVDRSVTGLIAQQQCVGPLQLPLADVSITARSLVEQTGGTAISMGEQPIKMLLSHSAGARMSVGEAITNMMFAKINTIENIKCSGNWMWAAKLKGEASNMYYAALAMSNMMVELGMALDGGKDSLSMAAKVGDELVKSPGELTLSCYADMPDVTKVATPDIKHAGQSNLWFIDIAAGKMRLGGSALAQVYSQIGDESPDCDDVQRLKTVFNLVQALVSKGIITAGHDRSDGGLITTVLEMAFAGNCGLNLTVPVADSIAFWCNEELGVVVEVPDSKHAEFAALVEQYELDDVATRLGTTTKEQSIQIKSGDDVVINESMQKLRGVWEETSHKLNRLQTQTAAAKAEEEMSYAQKIPEYTYNSTQEQKQTLLQSMQKLSVSKPKVAIIREEGSNGDREMAAAFAEAGFDVWDVHMSDLLSGVVGLADFRGVAFVGGFSYADTLGSAKGWASKIRFNEKLSREFADFYNRPDTFSLGVCNGCQLMGLLGWVPGTFAPNDSGRFESRWESVRINKSPSIMLSSLEGSHLGVWVAHGEGKMVPKTPEALQEVQEKQLMPVTYTDSSGAATEQYPYNPNGSPLGIAALCSEGGRHLAMMPHPERAFLKWQWPYMSEQNNKDWPQSPWLQMFKNARTWCDAQ